MEGALQDGAENYAETPLQLAAAAGDLKRAAGEAGVHESRVPHVQMRPEYF